MERIKFFIGLMSAALAIFGCSEETSGPEKKTGFSFTVTVVDSNGGPLPGLRVGRMNFIDGCTIFTSPPSIPAQQAPYDTLLQNYPNPFCGVTSIRFGVARESHVILELVDRHSERVRLLVNGLMQLGVYEMRWDQLDSTGQRALDGIYTYRLTMRDPATSEAVYVDSLSCMVYCGNNEETWDIGRTGADGIYATDDLDYFPGLIYHHPQPCIDPEMQHSGWSSFTDEVRIILRTDPPSQPPGWIYVMRRDVRLIDGCNSFAFEWEPDDSIAVTR